MEVSVLDLPTTDMSCGVFIMPSVFRRNCGVRVDGYVVDQRLDVSYLSVSGSLFSRVLIEQLLRPDLALLVSVHLFFRLDVRVSTGHHSHQDNYIT
jgi:hypothetical protein